MELWKFTRKDPKNEYFPGGNGNVFFLVIKRIIENRYSCYFYTKENYDINGKFKLVCMMRRTFDTNVKKKEGIAALCRDFLPYSRDSKYFYGKIDEKEFKSEKILETNDEEELKKSLIDNNIIVLSEYHYDVTKQITSKIENNTTLSDIEIMDIIGNISIERITSAKLEDAPNGYYFASIILNDNKLMSVFNYADSDYYKWIEDNFYQCSENIKTCAITRNIISIPRINNTFEKTYMYVDCDNDKHIAFKKIKINLNLNCENMQIVISAKETYHLDYCLGKKIVCTKILKTKNKEVSPFDMFGINSQTIRNPSDNYVFSNALCDYEFVLNNKEFFTKIGLFKLIGEIDGVYSLLCITILYICLIYDYPVIELLTKMGHTNLIEGIFSSLISSSRKSDIIDRVKELEQLINTNTTKGSLALRIPTYIGNYLIQNHCCLDEYKFWRDIYEIEGLSKEKFEEFLNMPERMIINAGMAKKSSSNFLYHYGNSWTNLGLQEILKYDGYTLNKTIKYCFAKHIENMSNNVNNTYYNNFSVTVGELKDTLLMAEELNFDLEPYPENLKQIHDQLSHVKREKTNQIQEKKVKEISEQSTAYMKKVFNSNAADLPTKAMEKYTYIFPSTQQEFTQEGQSQHNCVAGYFSRVQRGDCIIFFVRCRENVSESFITAEITKNGIAQVMYSNNRPVPAENDAYRYCKYIANKILHAIDMGEVKAIHKILL